jgi:hypothetical protein
MPWKCPACETQIRHDADVPEMNRVYRCHVCRLELVGDQKRGKLVVAPLPAVPEKLAERTSIRHKTDRRS